MKGRENLCDLWVFVDYSHEDSKIHDRFTKRRKCHGDVVVIICECSKQKPDVNKVSISPGACSHSTIGFDLFVTEDNIHSGEFFGHHFFQSVE